VYVFFGQIVFHNLIVEDHVHWLLVIMSSQDKLVNASKYLFL
jgi:hypothetical protein